MSEDHQDLCACCPYGYHIHVDFPSFAEEQLVCVANKPNILPVQTTPFQSPKFKCASKEKFSIYEQPVSVEETCNTKSSKPTKRESAYIQQKIFNLKNCATKGKEELYGVGLLEAIKEFEDFVGKTWGKHRSDKNNAALPTKSATTCCATQASTSHQFFSNLHEITSSPSSADQTDNLEASNDFCMSCQRKCLCKSTISIASLEDGKLASKFSPEYNSKSVNTEIAEHISTSTNTGTETMLVDIFPFTNTTATPRSERLSKLTIRKQNPTTQQPDCGGEGNVSNPRAAEGKCEIWEDISEIEEVNLLPLQVAATESKDSLASSVRVPSEDMKVALNLVNAALLHGKRTGVLAAMSFTKSEWFSVVGAKTVNDNSVLNYINAFRTLSPQLLRHMVNVPDDTGITALHYAVSYGNYPVVSKLIDTGVIDPNKANKAGYTSIMLASLAEITNMEEEAIIRKLISLGDVNIKAAQHCQTALMLAASHGRFKMVKLLLEAGAEVNVQDEDGSTALMCAVEHGHADIVQCLLAQRTCDPNIADNDGLTALNVAMDANHKDIAVLLYAHMHFFATSSSISGVSADNLLSKRSQSITITSLFEAHKAKRSSIMESPCVARKQHSSIN